MFTLSLNCELRILEKKKKKGYGPTTHNAYELMERTPTVGLNAITSQLSGAALGPFGIDRVITKLVEVVSNPPPISMSPVLQVALAVPVPPDAIASEHSEVDDRAPFRLRVPGVQLCIAVVFRAITNRNRYSPIAHLRITSL